MVIISQQAPVYYFTCTSLRGVQIFNFIGGGAGGMSRVPQQKRYLHA